MLTVHAQDVHMDGRASYYHNSLHGRKMANGQRYNRDSLTCAHRSLPFGTVLRVTNPSNGRQVFVKVTDRGPYARGRVIDLSYAAARQLGTLARGVAMVQIEVMPKETQVPYRREEGLELPELEYGAAGVCYEYIPEWEKVKTKPKTIPRKVKRAEPSKHKAGKSAQPQQNKNHAQKPAPKAQPAKPKQQKEKGSSWSNFFEEVKNGVTNLFD